MSPANDLITVEEAARIMRISTRTVGRYRSDGRLPFVQFSPRMIRYRRSDIENFVTSAYREQCDYCE